MRVFFAKATPDFSPGKLEMGWEIQQRDYLFLRRRGWDTPFYKHVYNHIFLDRNEAENKWRYQYMLVNATSFITVCVPIDILKLDGAAPYTVTEILQYYWLTSCVVDYPITFWWLPDVAKLAAKSSGALCTSNNPIRKNRVSYQLKVNAPVFLLKKSALTF